MIGNPWFSIWFHPKATIRKIVEENPNRSLWLLATIYGFSSLLNLAQSISIGETAGIFFIFILALLIAPAWGWIVFSFWSCVIHWSGKLLKGRGEFKAIRAAYSWSCVPLIFNIALWFVLVTILGKQIFFSTPDLYFTQAQVTFLFFILIAKVVLAVWSLVIYLNTLAEPNVNRYFPQYG